MMPIANGIPAARNLPVKRNLMPEPRLFLTSMCGPSNEAHIRAMIDPIVEWLDGIVWVLNDCPATDGGAQYLETVKGLGKVVHRPWPAGRHWAAMNDTLYTGLIEDGDLVIWTDLLEQPAAAFVSRIKGEIRHFMDAASIDCLFYYGKAFLFRYHEQLEYRNSPHWSLHGLRNPMEWSKIEPDETKVRNNVRPLVRTDPLGWVVHYAKYWLYPAGSNHALLGIEKQGPDIRGNFAKREAQRLAFRQEVRKRGFPLTVDGMKALLTDPNQLDFVLKSYINGDKTINDAYRLWALGDTTMVDTHDPKDMKPIP